MEDYGLIPISAIRNHVCGDPIVDWLQLYGRDHGYVPDDELPGYLPQCDFLNFIRRKGKEFEEAILELIRQRLDCHVPEDTEDPAEAITLLMRHGVDALIFPTLIDRELGIIGEPDILVRADRLNALIPNTITPAEANQPAPGLGTPWHYRAIDIKFTTVDLAASGEISNNGSQQFYKGQLALYTSILAKLQGFDPMAAYLLGRSWKQGQERADNALDKLLRVSFPQILNRGRDIRDWTSEALEAVRWLNDVRSQGLEWNAVPEPTRQELRPDLGTDSNWRKAKQQIALEQEDLTMLWNIGGSKRNEANAAGITRYTDPRVTGEVLGLKGDQAQTLNAMLDVNLKPGPPVRPASIPTARNAWGTREAVEFFVDFETVSDLDDSFEGLPGRGGYPGIFMIGCGHEEDGWKFECFIAETLDEEGERRILEQWLEHMNAVRDRLAPNILKPMIYHWSAAEVSQAETAYKSALKRLQEDRLRGLNWFDLWREVFKATPIAVNGAWGFGLKGIAKNMQRHGLIKTTWADGPTDGLGAMAGAWWCYAESQATGVSINDIATPTTGRTLMREIRDYNEVDCKVMWEILRYLRETPDTRAQSDASTAEAETVQLILHRNDKPAEPPKYRRINAYQAKYIAHQLLQRHPSDSIDRFAGALVDAQVDLNPHQVEAALFAFQSPFSKGAVLADEVGLGKTIEAGLVISQRWAERKRRILIITPANLRKQWHQELQEKFFLPGRILETRSYNAEIKVGNFRPLEPANEIVICSYQFAKAKAAEIARIEWDLVVIDEAHRLRNVYKPGNIVANAIKNAVKNAPKLLLTATPLQNSLLELFGLVSIIDEHAFGDLQSFRDQYARLDNESIYSVLKARLKPICHRTLRRQVVQYVSYTKRHSMVEPFTPEASEDRLYHLVSDYLRRDNLVALPNSQRALMTLVLRKLLASSTFAIAGALDTLIARLEGKLARQMPPPLFDALDQDFETLDEMAEELSDDEPTEEPLTEEEIAALSQEIEDLKEFRDLAISASSNAKGNALLVALEKAFAEAQRLGADRKAIIFTESRKTQDYLVRLLTGAGYGKGLVMFNGSNTDDRSKEIYRDWIDANAGSDRITGSRTADMRSALVDYFREDGQIMIATEAGAEGINLQFCSLVVNYDLPWNPQRIEQRIGRCHRYGQKHDVVVVNFLNVKNEADQRVFELLKDKFKLFEGVFGASDEVLGAIESGVDLEKRIGDIYQRCRTKDEINDAFAKLQGEFDFEIQEEMKSTRTKLLENFDVEVHEKLRTSLIASNHALDRYEKLLADLTRYELRDHAEFSDTEPAFELQAAPVPRPDIPIGRYAFPKAAADGHTYRLGHPLAQQVVNLAADRKLDPVEITFDYTNNPGGRISILEPYVGQSGELTVTKLTVEALDQAEDHLILSAVTNSGEVLDAELIGRLLGVDSALQTPIPNLAKSDHLRALTDAKIQTLTKDIGDRNAVYFEQEADKLDEWADDLKVGLEREIKDLDRQIREAKRTAQGASGLEAKLEGQKTVRKLEADRNARRRSLFEAQDEIDGRRQALIEDIESRMKQAINVTQILSIAWKVV